MVGTRPDVVGGDLVPELLDTLRWGGCEEIYPTMNYSGVNTHLNI